MQIQYKSQSVQELTIMAIQKTYLISDYNNDLKAILTEIESRLDPSRPVQLDLF